MIPEQPTTPQEHHEFSPSKFPAWSECPCFDGEIRDDSNEDGYANRGTLQHAAVAKALLGEPEPYAGLTEREAEDARWAAEKNIEIAEAAGYTRADMRIEQRVTLLGPDFKPLYFGTPDNEFGPFQLDDKFGDEHQYFAQMCGYALPKMERDETDSVMCRIIYGRRRRVVPYTIKRSTAEAVVYGILAKRQSPLRRPVACSYCGWCAHKLTCPAINAIVEAVQDKRNDWTLKLPTAHVSQAPNDPVVLGALRYIWKTFMEKWGSSVDYASGQLGQNGVAPLGYMIREDRAQLEFTSSEAVAKAMIKAGVTGESILSAAEFSMKGLCDAYHAQFGGTKKAAAERVEEVLVSAGAAKRGPKVKKLIKLDDAEDLLRMALARPVAPALEKEQPPKVLA